MHPSADCVFNLEKSKISLVSASTTSGFSDVVVVSQRTCPSRMTSIFRTLFKRPVFAMVHMEGSRKYDADGNQVDNPTVNDGELQKSHFVISNKSSKVKTEASA